MTDLSIIIGLLTFISFLIVAYIAPSTAMPRPQKTGVDFIVVFLLLGDVVRFYFFNTTRTDALAVLEGDFSIGNISTMLWTALAALYLTFLLLTDRFRISWYLCAPYRWISIMLILNVMTAAWSIVPEFTLYRAGELVVWVGLTVYFFSRMEFVIDATVFIACYGVIWILMNLPTLFDSVSQGVVFSAIKDNFLPTIGFATIALGWVTDYWLYFSVIGVLIFILAGSAAAVPSAVASGFAGLALHRTLGVKIIGYAGLVAVASMTAVYLVSPDRYQEIAEYIALFLQKPAQELLNATGRYAIWSIIWDVTKDNYFGSGFGSDRFIQLLGNITEVNWRLGTSSVFIMSAHDAALSAWTAAGWPGVIALLFVSVTGLQYCSRPGAPYRLARTMIIVFIIFNSISVPGLAGFFSSLWIVWIATLALDGQKSALASEEALVRY